MSGILFLALVSAPAFAQTATSEALFRDGKRLMKEGKLDEACAKFQASIELESSVGGLLNLADCKAKTKHTATAWGLFLKAASAARAANDAAREAEAKKQAGLLEPKLAYLTIKLAPDATSIPNLEITLDGVAQPAAAVGTATPVDEGEHVVAADAKGHRHWETKMSVGAGDRTASVTVPTLELVSGTATGVADAPPTIPTPPVPRTEPTDDVHATAPADATTERFERRKAIRLGISGQVNSGRQGDCCLDGNAQAVAIEGTRFGAGFVVSKARSATVDLVGEASFSDKGSSTDDASSTNVTYAINLGVDGQVHYRPQTWWQFGVGLGVDFRDIRLNTTVGGDQGAHYDVREYALAEIGVILLRDQLEASLQFNINLHDPGQDGPLPSAIHGEFGFGLRYFFTSL